MDTTPSLYDAFAGADALGPYEVVHIGKRTLGLKAIVVVDNLARGPALMPVRLTMDGSTEEALGLARAVTLSCALYDLPFGGGGVLVMGDPSEPASVRHDLFDGLGAAMAPLRSCIPLPDSGVDHGSFGRLSARLGRAIGIEPEALAAATAAGLSAAMVEASARLGLRLAGARIGLQGFGHVGRALARDLAGRGGRVVVASDRQGMAADPEGLDVEALIARKFAAGTVAGVGRLGTRDPSDAAALTCDVWCPTGRPEALDAGAAATLRARLVVEGTFGALTPQADAILEGRGIVVVPDLAAAAGGLIAAADLLSGHESAHGPASAIRAMTRRLARDRSARGQPLHTVALALATKRVPRSSKLRA
jgi:glutamate dehydrogenase/leucine dehydrogenase